MSQILGSKMKTSVLLLTLLAVALTSADSAQAAKQRKKAKDASVEAELRFKAGDEGGNDIKALKTEMLVIKSEKRALAQLLKLKEKYKGTAMEPEILFRLAELYMRRARSHRFFEVHKKDDQIVSLTPELVKEASESSQVKKAIGIYADIQGRFPNFRNMDIVIFNTAYANQQLGDDKAAEAFFDKITTNYPRSPLVADSYLAIGEINYNRKAFAKALESFKSVQNYPNARAYPYGLYKAAWCLYNMQDGEGGLRQLEKVVLFGRKVAEQKLDSKLDLRKEALNDMTVFYSDVRPSKGAVDYLLAQSEGLDPSQVLFKLSSIYNHHSKFPDEETVLKDMLSRLEKSAAIPTVREKLVWNYEMQRMRDKAVSQINALNEYCKDVPRSKKKKGDNSPDPATECLAKTAEVSKKLAVKWHGLWKKKQPTDELAAASEQAYRVYLENGAAASDPDLAKIRFSYAEILFQRHKYREASEQYATVQTAKPEFQLSHDASYAAVVSLEKAVEQAKDTKWSDKDEKLFGELAQVYLTKHSKGEWALELQFKRAFIAYEKERYDEAAIGFKQIGWNNAVTDKNRERVLKSQDLYLDILNVKKDYAGLRQAAESLVKKGIGDEKRMGTVEKIYREAYFAEIQQMEEKGELKAAIDSYKKFALENKNSELSSKAWWNASQLEFKMGDAQAGAATCYRMHQLFPNSSQGKDCLMKAAQTYEAAARLEPAARVLLNLAVVDDANATKWRELSADFFALSGGRDRAKEMYMKLAEGQKPARQLALFEKAMELEMLDENAKGKKQLEGKILALNLEPSTSLILIKQAEDLLERKQFEDAFSAARKILNRGGSKETSARARMIQAQVLEQEFRGQSVKARVEKIAMVLGMKTEKLEKAQKAYQETIKYGHPLSSVTALRKLSACYMHYVQAVREMPLPATLTEQEKQAFQGELESLVVPMEEKGIDTLNQALQAARKFEFHDGQVADIQNELNKLNMKQTSAPADIKLPPTVLPNFGGSASIVGVGL